MRKSIYLASAMMVCLTPGRLLAQETSAASPEALPRKDAEDRLDEIVVTAQRRTERLQDVPIAATSIAGDQLEDKAVDRVSDLQFASPSLSVTDAGETESVNIRGIGLSSNLPNVTNGVATYVDGLFQAQIVTAVPFYDIATVEVLRGPQGTLVGNNSTGGAIFVNSNSPNTRGISGYGQVAIGNYQRREIEGAINFPVSDTLAVRAAGILRKRDSYYEDVGPFDNHPDRLDEKGARLGVLWNPGRLEATLKLQIHDAESGGFAYRPVDGTPFAAFRVGGPRTVSYDSPTSQEERAYQVSLDLRYELASGITLRSLSGFQYKRNEYLQDTDATQVPITPAGGFVVDYYARDKLHSEEINIISPTAGRFDWILGGYYSKQDIYVDFLQVSPPPSVDYLPRQDRTTVGVFGQGNYDLGRGIEFQLGLRYSRVETDGEGDIVVGARTPGFPSGGIPVAPLGGSHTDARVTGKAAINWSVNKDHLLYAFVARGYKPGGFNSPASEFGPETVWDYELGWKGTLAGGRIRTQVGGFWNRYEGLQLDVLEPSTGAPAIRNVASATIKGLEAQAQARFGGLRLDGGIAYVSSKLDGITFINARLLPPGQLGPQCPPGSASTPPLCFDYGPFTRTGTGGPNLYSPKWTYNAGVEYRLTLGEATLTPRLNYGYVGPRWNYIGYGDGDRLAGRGLLSALLTLQKDAWRIEAWGTNLADKAYVSGRSGDNEFYGAPREYGLRLGINF